MRCLILSDSLALPRVQPERVDFEFTWPYLLKQKLGVEIIQTSIGAATSSDLLNQAHYFKNIDVDVVIIQCGIVDLTPRAFFPGEIRLLKKYRFLNFLLNKITNNKNIIKKIRNHRGITYTSSTQFRNNLRKLKNIFGVTIYWINVPLKVDEYDFIVPGVTGNIVKYNEVIKEVFGNSMIDISYFSYNEMMSDFHHLNLQGHFRLVEIIIEHLKNSNVIK